MSWEVAGAYLAFLPSAPPHFVPAALEEEQAHAH
jgi:hypothetical protein